MFWVINGRISITQVKSKTYWLQIFAWSLSLLAVLLAFMAWGSSLHWRIDRINSYNLFPFFGLVAFSLMWCHYIVSVVRQYLGIEKNHLHTYIEVTSFVVLVAIFAHPGLLEWQLWRDGFGLPPGNVLQHYVAPSLRVSAVLGMVSLLVFLAYELRRWYSDRSWWKYINYATDIAMLLIFLHGFKLGRTLQAGWLRGVWLFYGATLILALTYIYYIKIAKPTK